MIKYVFAAFMFIHGFIHSMGFAKAFNYAAVEPLTQTISKPAGIVWLLTGLLFVVAGILLIFGNNGWIWIAIAAVVLSQVLILGVWHDARFGSIANIIILILALLPLLRFNPFFTQ